MLQVLSGQSVAIGRLRKAVASQEGEDSGQQARGSTWGGGGAPCLEGSGPCPDHDWKCERPAGAGLGHVPSAPAWASSACWTGPDPVSHARMYQPMVNMMKHMLHDVVDARGVANDEA